MTNYNLSTGMQSIKSTLLILSCASFLLLSGNAWSQKTEIRGFVDVRAYYEKEKVSFGLGEQDLFITSSLSDRVSFLGESVFRYDPGSDTEFSVSIERIVLKYNVGGNHNILFGKHHTPLNYWNDTYHHGRLFFPTIDRPLFFSSEIIPFHTTGIGMQGLNLGKLKFGYDLMIGNGLGSSDVLDNDKHKSLTAAIHIKPADHLRIGASYYNDIISAGADVHGEVVPAQVNQHQYSASIAYFGSKFELLAESAFVTNHTDSTGTTQTLASYIYAGYRLTEKLTGYFRIDSQQFEEGDIYFHKNNATVFVLGGRYQINFLTVVKLEYQYTDQETGGIGNKVTAQVAIGF